jgi:hypothetical protein
MKVDLKLSGKTLVAGLAVFLGAVLAMAATITRGTDAGPVNAPALAQNIVAKSRPGNWLSGSSRSAATTN